MKSDITKKFTEIYEKEADMIFRFCLIKVSDRETAKDLSQEIFTRFYTTMFKGVRIENEKAFLFKIARNIIIDYYRKNKTISLNKMMDDEENLFEPRDEKSHKEIEMSAETKIALQALKKVREEWREVLHLRYVEDFEPKEIADMLQISANLVSVRITRGMEELRKMMGINLK